MLKNFPKMKVSSGGLPLPSTFYLLIRGGGNDWILWRSREHSNFMKGSGVAVVFPCLLHFICKYIYIYIFFLWEQIL